MFYTILSVMITKNLLLTLTNMRHDDDNPRRQSVIETSSVKNFRRLMRVTLGLRNEQDPDPDDALIVVVFGNSGIGKTFAIRGFLESVTGRTITGLPQVIRIEIKQKASPKGLAKQILHALGESPRGRELYDLIDEVIEAIESHGITMLIFDEADRLNEDTFEFLRSVVDATRRPIVLVGLPKIQHVIRLHAKFKNRVAIQIPFRALETDEILNLFLPNLVLPGWVYDASSQEDRAMGEFLWKRVRPVLRRIRNCLNIASRIALVDGVERITIEHIQEALLASLDDADEADGEGIGQEDIDHEDEPQERRHGSHEQESELRQDVKRKRGRGKTR